MKIVRSNCLSLFLIISRWVNGIFSNLRWKSWRFSWIFHKTLPPKSQNFKTFYLSYSHKCLQPQLSALYNLLTHCSRFEHKEIWVSLKISVLTHSYISMLHEIGLATPETFGCNYLNHYKFITRLQQTTLTYHAQHFDPTSWLDVACNGHWNRHWAWH